MANPVTTPAPRQAVPWWTSRAPARPDLVTVLRATLVCVVMLLLLAALGRMTGWLLFTAPLAATAMIVAGMPATPPAQPRSVVVGHLVSVAIGLAAGAAADHSIWTGAVAASLAMAAMVLTQSFHAPAAATAALVVATHPVALTALQDFAVGSVLVVVVGYLAGLMFPTARYPTYWW